MTNRPNKVKRPWVRERKPFERDRENDNFYNSRAWRRLRVNFLINNSLCVKCATLGLVSVATVVDHILPINKGGERLDIDNLQALCAKCHNSKSGSEAVRGMG